nr:unnamed protein product [Spirometra erinaceieuropaei]
MGKRNGHKAAQTRLSPSTEKTLGRLKPLQQVRRSRRGQRPRPRSAAKKNEARRGSGTSEAGSTSLTQRQYYNTTMF